MAIKNYRKNFCEGNFRKFRKFQANSRKFISRNTELNPTRENLFTQNFLILLFVKVYAMKNFL